MLKKLFLPAGLVAGIGAALVHGAAGTVLKDAGAVPWLVAAIFVVNGYQTDLRMFPRSVRFFTTLALAALISLAAGPFVGLWTGRLAGLAAGAALGLTVMAAVPPTLSSGIVISGVAGGNTLWALLLTIVLNFAGIFTVPFMLKMTVGSGGGVAIDSLGLLLKLVKMVLIPFLAGWGAARIIRRPLHPVLAYLPSTSVILTVWISLSACRGTLLEMRPFPIIIMGGAAFGVHILLLAGAWGSGLLLRLLPPERKALMFVGSQKTLPVALSVLAALGTGSGQAFIICIVFHFMQLLADSMIASKLA